MKQRLGPLGDTMGKPDPFMMRLEIKGPYADHILIPRAQPEIIHFLISNESPYFSSCKSKISASNSL